MSKLPTIGIVIPAYNSAQFIRATLNSVMAQSQQDWQCIVVDDGSTDETASIVKEFVQRDARFVLLSIPNSGQAIARNLGFAKLEPEIQFVTFMDSDDVWEPRALETLLSAIASDSDAIGAHGVGEFIDEAGNPLHPGVFSRLNRSRVGCRNGFPSAWPLDKPTCFETVLTASVVFPPGLILTRKSAVEKVGLFDPDLKYSEDWDLLIRLAREGYFAFVDEVIIKYRRHTTNTGTSTKVADQCARAFSKAYYSPLNGPEHRAIAKNAWRAKQVMAARSRLKDAYNSIRSCRPVTASIAFAKLLGIGMRYCFGAPKPFRAGDFFAEPSSQFIADAKPSAGSTKSSLWIILVNYKGGLDTIECLSSIRADAPDAHVVVVDNCSEDDSVDLIRSTHPWVQLIESKSNLGFTGGNNTGIKLALENGAKFIWLLNNDTVVEPGTTDGLLRAIESNSEYGIVTPRIDYYDTPGVPWFAGSSLDLSRGEAIHDNSNPPKSLELVDVPWISGCSMFCRREVLEETGGFDPRYFLNWEDVDLSLRAAALKWKLALVPASVIRHKVSRSLSKVSVASTYYWMRNRLLLTATHSDAIAVKFAKRDNVRIALRKVYRWQPGAVAGLAATWRASRDFNQSRYGQLRT